MATKDSAPAAGPGTGKQRLTVVIALTVGIAIGGVTGSLVVGPLVAANPAPECECDKAVAAAQPGAIHQVENLVLNPAQSGGTRFLIATVAFGARDSAVVQEMDARDAEVRDALLRVLGARTVTQLSESSVREELRAELLVEFETMFGPRAVVNVFFPQFVLQ